MEIKREFLAGELSDWRRAVPVGVAAGGGMLAPALLYLAATWPAPELTRGWGIPMATDAAFAIGLLTLMRKRIPASLITFVTALAIIDDLGAIVVIALFYSEHLHATYLGWAGGGVAVLLMANVLGVRSPYIYLLGGVCIWYALHHSGIHPTIAGILVAVTVPARPARDPDWFIARVRALIRHFEGRARNQGDMLEEDTQHELAENVADSARKATTPLQRWENFIEHPVYFVVMPSFALANAGIRIDSATLQAWADSPLSVGIGAGLIGGKVLGIAGATWLAVRLGVGEWPRDAGFRHVVGVALLAGIGFTMSIFIAGLTFPESSAEYDVAMISILLTSLIAALAGLVWLRWFSGER
jgi:NhaA family Na+:H+ antiporter